MEWSMPINEILREDITALNYTLSPPGYRGDANGVRAVQERLARVVDALGEQSARAQGLNKVITSADKLRSSAGHTLYLLKDAEANGGAGEAVGFLKVGRKHLFLFDHAGAVRELEPLCVLDFYVRAERQRRGLGRRLFDRMLRDAGLPAHMLAVDGPSPYMEHFLRKNYGIACLARQSNNFAVAPGFFDATTPEATRSGGSTPTPAAVGRFAALRPPSNIATVIHGEGGNTKHFDGYVYKRP